MSRNATKTESKIDYVTLLGADLSGFDSVTVENYRSAAGDRKAQAAIRATVKASQASAVDSMDGHAAKYWLNTANQLVTETASKSESVPNHVTLAHRVAVLRLAATLLESGDVVPDGMSADEIDYSALADVELMADPVIEAANKLASAKITRRTSSGDRRSISDVLDRAFDGVDAGTMFRVSEVVRRGSLEDYKPSPGAVVATFGDDAEKVTESGTYRLVARDNAGNPVRVQFVG